MQKPVGVSGRPRHCLANSGENQYADGVDSFPVCLCDDLVDVVGFEFIFHFGIPFAFPVFRVHHHFMQQGVMKQTINCQSMREKISFL